MCRITVSIGVPTSRLALLAVAAIAANVVQAEPSQPKRPNHHASGPYCGIYCLHRALHVVGRSVELEMLIEPKYIGSVEGSSIAELVSAAEACGATAVPIRGLTVDALQGSRQPILLHVAGSALSNKYNHWVLFLGVQGGQARIYDPPHEVALLPLARLLSISDGIGLVVQASETSQWASPAGWPWRTIAIVICGLGVAVAGRTARTKSAADSGRGLFRRFLATASGAALLVVAASVAAVALDAANADGLLRNAAAVAGVTNRFFPELLPEVGVSQVREWTLAGTGVAVDARMEDAYAAGHIPGAVNVPVTAGLFGHRAALGETPKTTPLVVYCQSDQCMWGRDVAFRLIADGYENVAVFTDGWRGWRAAESAHE